MHVALKVRLTALRYGDVEVSRRLPQWNYYSDAVFSISKGRGHQLGLSSQIVDELNCEEAKLLVVL
jgi:hypothetical protein